MVLVVVQKGVGFLVKCWRVGGSVVLVLGFCCTGLLCVLVDEKVRVTLVVGSSVGVVVVVV